MQAFLDARLRGHDGNNELIRDSLRGRLSFRRFVGMGFDEAVPGEITACLYRKELDDATTLDTSKGHKKEDNRSTRIPAAGFTKKNGKT